MRGGKYNAANNYQSMFLKKNQFYNSLLAKCSASKIKKNLIKK